MMTQIDDPVLLLLGDVGEVMDDSSGLAENKELELRITPLAKEKYSNIIIHVCTNYQRSHYAKLYSHRRIIRLTDIMSEQEAWDLYINVAAEKTT